MRCACKFRELRREIDKVSGDAAIDVTIEYKTTFTAMLLNDA